MKQVFIDKFVIPENAFKEFSERMNYNRSFIKKITGFIQDKVYKSKDEVGNIIIITMAEWKDEESLLAAKALVKEEYTKINFNPGEFTAKLNIKMERGIFNEINSY